MRVIAGIHKGRRLFAPDTVETRPVTDRVKESIFSSLGGTVRGARVADLFAGAGSFGIEALSRGAESVTFVERGHKALIALRSNLAAIAEDAAVEAIPVERFVTATTATFDLVFCDPPWPLGSPALSEILVGLRPHLSPEAIVIVTRRANDFVPEPAGYAIDDDRRHGDTRIIRYTLKDWE
jgi:16S rRNA (guanine966-N2)-methyltransferase